MKPEDEWLLVQARGWMSRLGLGVWHGDVAAGIKDAAPVPASDPALHEVQPLLQSIAGREPTGLAPRAPKTQIPPPWWRLAWLDVDADGQQEIAVTAGCSPAPYYAILQRAKAGSAPWRILHEAPFRFLGSVSHSGRVYFFGGFDGYAFESPVLAIDWFASRGEASESKHHLVFNMLEVPAGMPSPTQSVISLCTTTKTTRLRAGPEQDDQPADRGLPFEFQGNVFSTLASGSTGWTLRTEKGKDGNDWALCCFVGRPPMESQDPAKDALAPKTLVRQPLESAESLLVGWVLARDLAER